MPQTKPWSWLITALSIISMQYHQKNNVKPTQTIGLMASRVFTLQIDFE